MKAARGCIFCAIVRGEESASRVYEDELCVAFLDHRPLLHGHCLLVPRTHAETLPELPDGLVAPLFGAAKLLARAVEEGLEADGSFVAINNKISQSVPHLHVHVVPRWKSDGLFSPKLVWKRTPYRSEPERRAVQEKIRLAVERLIERSET
jgi:histidine triad (HIT) family protein